MGGGEPSGIRSRLWAAVQVTSDVKDFFYCVRFAL